MTQPCNPHSEGSKMMTRSPDRVSFIGMCDTCCIMAQRAEASCMHACSSPLARYIIKRMALEQHECCLKADLFTGVGMLPLKAVDALLEVLGCLEHIHLPAAFCYHACIQGLQQHRSLKVIQHRLSLFVPSWDWILSRNRLMMITNDISQMPCLLALREQQVAAAVEVMCTSTLTCFDAIVCIVVLYVSWGFGNVRCSMHPRCHHLQQQGSSSFSSVQISRQERCSSLWGHH